MTDELWREIKSTCVILCLLISARIRALQRVVHFLEMLHETAESQLDKAKKRREQRG